jgi:site-specific recombinase XerD
MGIRERNGNWHYRFKVNGHEYTADTGLVATSRNESVALRIEAKARELVLDGKAWQLKLEVKPFQEASQLFIDWYKGEHKESSAKRVRVSFANINVFFAGKSVAQINPGDVEQYKTFRRGHSIKPVTLHHDLSALSGFFEFARKNNWCRSNPVSEVDKPSTKDSVRDYVLSPADEILYFQALSELAAGKHLKEHHGAAGQRKIAEQRYGILFDIARLMLLQGPRPEEVMRARVEDIDGDHWIIRYGKTDAAARRLLLTGEGKLIMERRCLAAPESGWLFPGKNPERHVVTLQRTHDVVIERCKLASLDLYCLRHTFATRAVERGVSLVELQAILGHGSIRTLDRYVHPKQSHIDSGMRRMEAVKVVEKEVNAKNEVLM